MKISRLLLLICLLGFAPALAEEPKRVTLPNGMSVIVWETYASPTVSLNVFIRAGSLHEDEESTGLAHFYEHMFFRGTPTRSGLQFKKDIESLGGTTNASTSRDMTHYYINLPSKYANEGLELLADALINAELAKEGIDKEREVVLEEYRIGENNPGRWISDKLYRMAFPEHPYGRPIIGKKSALETYERTSFKKWKETYYVPRRCSVVVVGDVDGDAIIKQSRRLFARLSGGDSVDDFPTPTPPAEPVVRKETGPVSQGYVLLGFIAPSVKSKPDIYQVDVLSFLMGQGRKSLLHQELVKDKELARSASVEFLTQAEPGLLVVAATGDPKKTDQIRDGLWNVIERVKKGEFTDRDLLIAKRHLLNTYEFGKESNSGKANNLGFYETIDDWQFALTYHDRIAAVDKAGVMAAAQRYLVDNHYSLIVTPGRAESASR